MRRGVFAWLFICISSAAFGQQLKTENIIVVTLDGYRWKEMFQGADRGILDNSKFTSDENVVKKFGGSTMQERRMKLMPFFWSTLVKEGQLHGNRKYRNRVNCTNHQLISYPGYSEMLVGFADRRVHSNEKKTNPNSTVLEFLNKQKGFEGRVAAFSTWDAFPYILHEKRSHIHVNAGTDLATGPITRRERWLNQNSSDIINPSNGSRYDEYTFAYALEFMKREKPRVLFLSFNETDEHGHAGRYDKYLTAAHKADSLISKLWQWVQSQPDYKNKTTLLVTTDHGRGSGKRNWTKHRLLAPGSRHIWFAVIGPDTPPHGEMLVKNKYFQKQFAKTISAFAGFRYHSTRSVGDVMQLTLRDDTKAHETKDQDH